MANKKISEFTTKSFLGESGATENSYILVNYAETANGTPVTYKASIKEIGNAISKQLYLLSLQPSGICTQEALSNGGYTYSKAPITTADISLPEGAMYVFEDNNKLVIGESTTGATSLADQIIETGYVKDFDAPLPLAICGSGLQYINSQGNLSSFIVDQSNLPHGTLFMANSSDPTTASYIDENGSECSTIIAPYESGMYPIVVNNSGILYYYNTADDEYKTISSLQNS